MTDKYWLTVVSLQSEVLSAGDSHPYNRAGDPELVAQIGAARPGEDDYVAPTVKSEDIEINHETGTCTVRVYRPDSDQGGRPLLVWVHGGAWAMGDLEGHEADSTAREVCSRADAVVVSVDYRLAAGGVHYPVPLDDVVAAYIWALSNAEALGADPARVCLGGGSAGGNLAAGAALRLRDRGEPLPVSLALFYPAMHPVLPFLSEEFDAQMARLTPAMTFAPELYRCIIENYLGGPEDQADCYAFPGLADDLALLPPTLIVNDEYDGLRASGEKFAQQLRDAGVPVVLDMAVGTAHGHLSRAGHPETARIIADFATWVAHAGQS